MLRARAAAFHSKDPSEYKKAWYMLRKSIKTVKSQYRCKTESCYSGHNIRHMWRGLRLINDIKERSGSMGEMTVSPEELNSLYAHFESSCQQGVLLEQDNSPFQLSRADVCKTLEKVNIQKAPRPDNIPGCIFKVCAHKLVDISQTFSMCPFLRQ